MRKSVATTVCIGLVCSSGENILLAADTKPSYGAVTSNEETGKLFELPFKFIAAVAGTLNQCESVISELVHRMEQFQGQEIPPEQVRQYIVDSYRQVAIVLGNQALRNELGITFDEYKQDKGLVPSILRAAIRILRSTKIDVDLIVAGFYKNLPVQFVVKRGTSVSVRPEITPDNATIGSGGLAALNWLNYRKQNMHFGLAHSLMHITEAKQFAQIEKTVGEMRQMILLWPGGFKALEGGQELFQDWWNRYGLPLTDKLEEDSFNQIVRTTFGITQ